MLSTFKEKRRKETCVDRCQFLPMCSNLNNPAFELDIVSDINKEDTLSLMRRERRRSLCHIDFAFQKEKTGMNKPGRVALRGKRSQIAGLLLNSRPLFNAPRSVSSAYSGRCNLMLHRKI